MLNIVIGFLGGAAPEQVQQVIESSLSLGETGLAVAVCIAILQCMIKMIKVLAPQSPVIKLHGQKIVVVASALLAVLTPVAVGMSWIQAILIFVAGGATTYVNDFFHAMGWIEHTKRADGTPKLKLAV